jgi:hypothetical protein
MSFAACVISLKMHRAAHLLVTLALAFPIASCSSASTPDGTSGRTPEGTPGSGPARTPESALPPDQELFPYTEAEVQTLLRDRRHGCTDCHHAGSDGHMNLAEHFTRDTVGIARDAGRRCGQSAFSLRIAPGDRQASLLWHKVRGTHDCGGRMPAGSAAPLDATEIERLGLYIDALER